MAKDFRIAVIGQAAFGKSVLEALLDHKESVVGVFCPPDRAGGAVDPIKEHAVTHGIDVHQFKRMRDREAIDAFKALNADLGVMAFVTDIVPLEIIQAPTRGTIQYHPSLLPKHRGPSSINWPIIMGETRTGLSIFWPDDGLDTGPILLQKEVEIGPDDTLGTVYFDKLFPLGVEAMVESVRLVKAGKAPRIEQDHSQMTYESWCKAEDAVIDWSKPATEVYNLVRGCDPSPGANSTFNGQRMKIFSTSREDGEFSGVPGEVVSIDDRGFVVRCGEGGLRVGRLQADGQKKQAATEWAQQAGLEVGQRFGQ